MNSSRKFQVFCAAISGVLGSGAAINEKVIDKAIAIVAHAEKAEEEGRL